MFFIAAIWGVVLGVILPVGMLIFPEAENAPLYIPILWLAAAVIGFIAPCVLVRLKLYRLSAALSLAGAVGIIIVHFALMPYTVDGQIAWFYMPLLAETAAVVTLAVLDHAEKTNAKHNAPAESILGKLEDSKYKMRSFEDESRKKTNNKKNNRRRK